jgi:hypothetical protein
MIIKNEEEMRSLREQVSAIKLKYKQTAEKYGIDAVVGGSRSNYNGRLIADISLSYDSLDGNYFRPPGTPASIVINDIDGLFMAKEVAKKYNVLLEKNEKPSFEVRFIEAKEVGSGIVRLGNAKEKFETGYAELNRIRTDSVKRILRL